VAHGDWSTWMMWKREESKKHKGGNGSGPMCLRGGGSSRT